MVPDFGGVVLYIMIVGAALSATPFFVGGLGGTAVGRLYPGGGIAMGALLGTGLGFTGVLVCLAVNWSWLSTLNSWNSAWWLVGFAVAPAITSVWSVAITKFILGVMRPAGVSGGVAWFLWFGVALAAGGLISVVYGALRVAETGLPFPPWPVSVLVVLVGGFFVLCGKREQ